MKIKKIIAVIVCSAVLHTSFAQIDSTKQVPDSSKIDSSNIHYAKVDSLKIDSTSLRDTIKTVSAIPQLTPSDAKDVLHNEYGDLLNDDPLYNRRYPAWIPATRVVLQNGFTWFIDRYIFNYDWSHIGPQTWKQNLRQGWEWDDDKFGVNFVGHPYSGSSYFNIARSNGYSYWGSLPFAIEGSLMWEYFGETTRPSYNDFINTPVSGLFLGEILYRISSNILDDRTTGAQRFFRELFAGILDPARAMNRLTQGKMFRHTTQEVYQKDRLNITLYTGMHKVNDNQNFWSGPTNEIFHIQLDYGNPFEERHRKPFDLFRLRTELSYGGSRKQLLENVTGYGILFGKNILPEDHGLLIGAFQHYDYWNNKVFEIGTIGFGGGLISRIPAWRNTNIYSGLHIAAVPLAGASTFYGPDTSEFRNYIFGGGLEGKAESTINIGNWISLGFTAYYYWINAYQGLPGYDLVGILKPRITLKLIKNLSVGFEQHYYFNDRVIDHITRASTTTTEQKLFLQLFLEDPHRRGKYH